MKQPLVTVIVITYNSSEFVIETLESVKEQTYGNIELIVSDDCSTDNTAEITRNWLEHNKDCFVSVVQTNTGKNKGICGNYNHGLKHASGKWIKYIAGDDMLTPECIETYVNYAETHDDKVVIGGTQPFSSEKIFPNRNLMDGRFGILSVREQELHLLREGTVIEGPTLFLERKWLIDEGGFEEKYPMIEDYPLVMKSLSRGFHIGQINACEIKYREYPESVSRNNPRFAESIYRAISFYAPKAALRQCKLFIWWHYKLEGWILNNYHGEKKKKLLAWLCRLLDPIYWKKNFYTHEKA